MVEATRNFCTNRNFDGLDEKVENPLFLIFEFRFHEVTLEGDLAYGFFLFSKMDPRDKHQTSTQIFKT